MESTTQEDKIQGKTFMFTGTLSVPRDDAQRIVEELGGTPGHSVSRSTDYLICGADQVGKSGKWEKAGLLGVTRVDEDFFWNLVEEARSAVESEDEVIVHLSPEELENGITDEHWEIIAENCPNLRIMTAEQFERLLKAFDPSYENPDKSQRIKKEYPELVKLGASPCPHCSKTIPYSIWRNRYYCFNCHHYSHETVENHQHFHEVYTHTFRTRTFKYLACKFCGEFMDYTKTMIRMDILGHQQKLIKELDYENSLEYAMAKLEYRKEEDKRKADRAEIARQVDKMLEGVHVCTDYEKDEEGSSERGTLLRCKVCRNSKFVSMDKFEAFWKKKIETRLTK